MAVSLCARPQRIPTPPPSSSFSPSLVFHGGQAPIFSVQENWFFGDLNPAKGFEIHLDFKFQKKKNFFLIRFDSNSFFFLLKILILEDSSNFNPKCEENQRSERERPEIFPATKQQEGERELRAIPDSQSSCRGGRSR